MYNRMGRAWPDKVSLRIFIWRCRICEALRYYGQGWARKVRAWLCESPLRLYAWKCRVTAAWPDALARRGVRREQDVRWVKDIRKKCGVRLEQCIRRQRGVLAGKAPGTGECLNVKICNMPAMCRKGAKRPTSARISLAISAILMPEEAIKMFNKGHQKIDCRVCSCEHHGTGDVCDLECICVQPMNGADHGDAASQTLCGSYKCRK